MTEPMTPDLPAIRQRAQARYQVNGLTSHGQDIQTLLTLWDTHQTALRRLVEQWRALAGREEGTEIAWCADQLAALLPPEAEQA